MDTIYALATPRGKSGVAVIRVSGPHAAAAAARLSAGDLPARQAVMRHLVWQGLEIDHALILRFEGPASFSGEDIVEFHTHGAVAVVDALLRSLSEMPDLRPAEPGEFTRRALENEKLDLAQVEGLSDLIEAETEAQRRQAMSVFSGALGQLVEEWRVKLIRAAALLEATIDFADEEVPVDVMPEVVDLLEGLKAGLVAQGQGVRAAERIRDGFEVAIVGPPNSGKSTLLNALAGRDAALTSDVAGTTRDVIEVRMDLSGLPVTFLDTAGLRVASDQVEELGIERAKTRAAAADLRVILLGPGDEGPVVEPLADDIVIRSKSDIETGADVSGSTGAGLDVLVDRITSVLGGRASGAGVAIRERHRRAIETAIASLDIALDRIKTTPELSEIVAEELRVAIIALDSLVGRVDVEDLLDDIFANFCIGK